MLSNHLILCRPAFNLSQHQGLFQCAGSAYMHTSHCEQAYRISQITSELVTKEATVGFFSELQLHPARARSPLSCFLQLFQKTVSQNGGEGRDLAIMQSSPLIFQVRPREGKCLVSFHSWLRVAALSRTWARIHYVGNMSPNMPMMITHLLTYIISVPSPAVFSI